MFLQGLCLWVPVEKLFMTEIGFDARMFGVMAAAYAVVTPVLEIPSGILADRWSRRGVLLLAVLALFASVAVGGLSTNVVTYTISAMILGVYFAMQSGTLEAVVYDTVLEESGDSDDYERQFGRMQVANSVALVIGSLAGGVLAEVTQPRTTYLLSLPAYALAAVALVCFREPRLHRAADRIGVGEQVAATVRAITGKRRLLPVVAGAALGMVLLQMLIEFGPLWLVAFGAAAVVFGPYTAAIMATLGVGGLLAGRVRFSDQRHLAAVAVIVWAGSFLLVVSDSTVVVIVAQVVLATVFVVTGIHLSKVLHDEVPSSVRAGVASGVGTLSALVFLPCALGFGFVTERFGVPAGGWIVVALCAVVLGLLWRVRSATAIMPPSAGSRVATVDCGRAADTEVA